MTTAYHIFANAERFINENVAGYRASFQGINKAYTFSVMDEFTGGVCFYGCWADDLEAEDVLCVEKVIMHSVGFKKVVVGDPNPLDDCRPEALHINKEGGNE